MIACFELCFLNLYADALFYLLCPLTRNFWHYHWIGESFWLVFLISVAEVFDLLSFRGEAKKPSRLTRGFVPLEKNSNRVCFVLFLQFSFYSIWFFWFVLSVFSQIGLWTIQISKAPNLDTERTDSWSKWFCFERKSMETISYEFFVT